MLNKPTIIQGNVHRDARGSLQYVNDGQPGTFKRFYIITHPNTEVIRAWQGHKKEEKSFFVLKGCFTIGVVQPMDFEKLSPLDKPQYFSMKEEDSLFLKVPGGCYTGIKAGAPDSALLVLSGDTLENSTMDDFRLPADTWVDWPVIKK